MNYIGLINNFWEKDRECNFSDKEIALYFYLLGVCNHLTWKNPFGQSNAMMIAKFGWGKSSFDTAKKRLKDAGLIDFKAGDGRGNVYQYEIVNAIKEQKKGIQKHPLSDTLYRTLSDTLSNPKPETSINLNQTKTKKENTPLPPEGELAEKIDLDFYVSKFNAVCKSLPKIQKLSEARKKKLAARIKEFGESKIVECFELAEKSEFLSGRGGKWQASFDWLIEPKNFLKVIEGNYKNSSAQTPSTHLGTLQTDTSKW